MLECAGFEKNNHICFTQKSHYFLRFCEFTKHTDEDLTNNKELLYGDYLVSDIK